MDAVGMFMIAAFFMFFMGLTDALSYHIEPAFATIFLAIVFWASHTAAPLVPYFNGLALLVLVLAARQMPESQRLYYVLILLGAYYVVHYQDYTVTLYVTTVLGAVQGYIEYAVQKRFFFGDVPITTMVWAGLGFFAILAYPVQLLIDDIVKEHIGGMYAAPLGLTYFVASLIVFPLLAIVSNTYPWI